MGKISRRQLLKGGAGGALALGALSVGATGARASDDAVAVHIHGVLTLVGGTLTVAVSIDAAGREDALAGAGWDSGTTGTTGMVPTTTSFGPVGACFYTVAGHINDDDIITLQGRSLFTNRPPGTGAEEGGTRSDTRADGRLVEVTANLETGAINWSLGGIAFAGTGVVTKID